MTGILGVVDYDQAFPELVGIYLEDSWVLEVAPTGDGVSLRVEAVVTPEHPRYRPPPPNEQHCYLTGWLTLRSSAPVDLRLSGSPPAADASGERDYGNIDSLVGDAHDVWEMEGDWGYARLVNPDVTLRLD